MRKTILLLMFLFAAASVRAADTPEPGPDGVQSAKSFKTRVTRTVSADYLLFLPKEYKASGKTKWPLIYFLHGSGERGTNVWKTGIHGPPKLVRERPDFPFIVLSPQCAPGQRWDNDALIALLDDVIHKYRVDTKRMYLTGLSMGGYGTWSLGLACPERFAAIAPICGGGGGGETVIRCGDRRQREHGEAVAVARPFAVSPSLRLSVSLPVPGPWSCISAFQLFPRA